MIWLIAHPVVLSLIALAAGFVLGAFFVTWLLLGPLDENRYGELD